MPNLFIVRSTVIGDQASPPRGVLMPRSVNASAIARGAGPASVPR
jgi:hypothetical protein